MYTLKGLSSRWHCGTYLGAIRYSLLRKHQGWLPSPPWSWRAAGAAEGDGARAGSFWLLQLQDVTCIVFHLILHSGIVRLVDLNHHYVRMHGGGFLAVLSPTDILI